MCTDVDPSEWVPAINTAMAELVPTGRISAELVGWMDGMDDNKLNFLGEN